MRLATIVVLVLTISRAGLAQDKQIPFTASLSGAEMFKTWCASCHGIDAKGNGPAAAALKKMPPNLTLLAKQSGGKFPTQRVREYIDGTGKGSTPAHGSREMPVWGDALKQISDSQPSITYRITTLATYIESLQEK
jgi:mono/diheme cytochrome c family protein